MSSSGGVIYHLRALRFAKDKKSALWESHREGVRKFFDAWNPSEKTLLLVGPSGGYSIPKAFLEKFASIIAIEPDPLARLIFEKRFNLKPTWIRQRVDFKNLDHFRHLIPRDSAILFANILGQVKLPRIASVKKALTEILKGHSWASYHDALSGENMQFDAELATPFQKATLAQMKGWIYPMGVSRGTLVVNAHEAPDLFPARDGIQFRYWQWLLTKKRGHLIEGAFQSVDKKSL